MQMSLSNCIHKGTVYFGYMACSSFPNNNKRLIILAIPHSHLTTLYYHYFAYNTNFTNSVFAHFE